MKQLDFDVLKHDADDYTVLLIDLWLHGVSFDGVFSHDDLFEFLYPKLQPRVLEVLSSDTMVDYEQVRNIFGTEARPEMAVTARNRWGENQFLNAMHENLDLIEEYLQCAQPPTAIVPLDIAQLPTDDPEPMRLSQYILRNWLNRVCNTDNRPAMEERLLPAVLSLTSEYWNTPRHLPKDDVIYWFDEYMMPAVSPFIRKDWSAEQIIHDIQMTFVTLNTKVVFEDQNFQHTTHRRFNSAVEQRRSKHNTVSNKQGVHYLTGIDTF